LREFLLGSGADPVGNAVRPGGKGRRNGEAGEKNQGERVHRRSALLLCLRCCGLCHLVFDTLPRFTARMNAWAGSEGSVPPSYTCGRAAIQENSKGRNMTRLGDSFRKATVDLFKSNSRSPSGMTTRKASARKAKQQQIPFGDDNKKVTARKTPLRESLGSRAAGFQPVNCFPAGGRVPFCAGWSEG
jgi:hypothetical protein